MITKYVKACKSDLFYFLSGFMVVKNFLTFYFFKDMNQKLFYHQELAMGVVLGYILVMAFSMSFYLLGAVFGSILLLNAFIFKEYPSLLRQNKSFFTFIACGAIISFVLNMVFMNQLKHFLG